MQEREEMEEKKKEMENEEEKKDEGKSCSIVLCVCLEDVPLHMSQLVEIINSSPWDRFPTIGRYINHTPRPTALRVFLKSRPSINYL